MNTKNNNSSNHKLFYFILLIVLFFISLIVGYFGFRQYFIQNDIDHDFWRILYCSLQLFVMQSGDLPGSLPFGLHLARFLAPLVPAIAIILTMLEIFREQWNALAITRWKNHIVIFGFGTKGQNIMNEYLKKGYRVLVIDSDSTNPNLDFNNNSRRRKLIGNATSINTLKKAHIVRAAYCFLMMGDDNQQVKTCLNIYQQIIHSGRDKNNPLICIMHLQKQEFQNFMKDHFLLRGSNAPFELRIFNLYENSARHLFLSFPPDRSGLQENSKSFVQIIIFGFGYAGEALALQTAYIGHYANKKKPQVVIFDREAKTKVPEFKDRFPSFTDFCDMEFDMTEADSPQLLSHLLSHIKKPNTLTTLVFCFDNKTQNLLLSLQLHSMTFENLNAPVQIFYRTKDESAFSNFPEIKPYGLPAEVCSHETIFGENLDKMAKAMHINHMRITDRNEDWDELSYELKDSNRKQADHIGVKMRAISCYIVAEDDSRPEAVFLHDEIEMLARLEHQRWCAERLLAGWTLGETKNLQAKISPSLITYEKLSKQEKDWDREAVKNIPSVLKLVGQKVVRKE